MQTAWWLLLFVLPINREERNLSESLGYLPFVFYEGRKLCCGNVNWTYNAYILILAPLQVSTFQSFKKIDEILFYWLIWIFLRVLFIWNLQLEAPIRHCSTAKTLHRHESQSWSSLSYAVGYLTKNLWCIRPSLLLENEFINCHPRILKVREKLSILLPKIIIFWR